MGLDVHAAKVVAAIADSRSGELAVQRMGGATDQVAEFCAGLPAPVRVAYEAGPTGFGLARALAVRGIECTVAAPGKIERPAQDRVKTDRRDAERLVRLLMIGGLHPVRVPTPAEEAMRDLVRAREDVRGDLMRARHRVAKLLAAPRPSLRGQQLDRAPPCLAGEGAVGEPVAQSVLADGIGAIEALLVRRDDLEAQMASLVEGSPWEQTVARLRCLRGIDTLSALGLCAEVGDFERFARPAQLMSYLGLVPSESSSGETPPPGRDHQVGLPPRPPPPGRGRLALPPRAAQRPRAAPPPGGPAPGGLRDLLEGPAAPSPQLGPPRLRARQAPHPLRRRRGSRAGRLLLGGSDSRLRPPSIAWPRRRRARPFAPAHPRFSYEQPSAATLGPRQRALRRNPVLR